MKEPKAIKLVLDTISKDAILDSVKGGSCFYSETQENNKYILFYQMITNYTIIRINDTINILKAISNNSNKATTSDSNEAIFSNAIYTLTLHTTNEKWGKDESYKTTGKMTLKSKDGQSITAPLYGECGD